ncbi:MAG: hypothetical protein HYT76_00435 [Deltaproteobacteria bacterium]|nr:hypothetical protein [Deltaproteobacteria bacterium]
MLRTLFLIFLGYLTYRMLRLFLLPMRKVDFQKKGKRIEAEEMVACNRCGTFVAQNQAISKNSRLFCSVSCSS